MRRPTRARGASAPDNLATTLAARPRRLLTVAASTALAWSLMLGLAGPVVTAAATKVDVEPETLAVEVANDIDSLGNSPDLECLTGDAGECSATYLGTVEGIENICALIADPPAQCGEPGAGPDLDDRVDVVLRQIATNPDLTPTPTPTPDPTPTPAADPTPTPATHTPAADPTPAPATHTPAADPTPAPHPTTAADPASAIETDPSPGTTPGSESLSRSPSPGRAEPASPTPSSTSGPIALARPGRGGLSLTARSSTAALDPIGPVAVVGQVLSAAAASVGRAVHPEAAAAVATEFGFPILLTLAVLAFLGLQGHLDRRDPKLRMAPEHAIESYLTFQAEDRL